MLSPQRLVNERDSLLLSYLVLVNERESLLSSHLVMPGARLASQRRATNKGRVDTLADCRPPQRPVASPREPVTHVERTGHREFRHLTDELGIWKLGRLPDPAAWDRATSADPLMIKVG